MNSAEDAFLRSDVSMVVACAKLYRRSCFNGIRYPIGRIHEDEFTTHKILFAEERVSVLTAAYYAYYINPQGITKSNWNPKKLDVVQAYEEQIAYFNANGYPRLAKVILQTLAVNILKQIGIVKQADNRQYWWPYLCELYIMRTKMFIRCIMNNVMEIWLLERFCPRIIGWCIKYLRPILKRKH